MIRKKKSSSTARVTHSAVTVVLLRLQQVDLVFKRLDVANGFLDRRLVAARLLAPAVVVVDVLSSAAFLGFDLEAQLALVLEWLGLPDHLHAACLACAVLGLAMLLEVAPLPVAALVDVLLVEAHDDGWNLGGVSVSASRGGNE